MNKVAIITDSNSGITQAEGTKIRNQRTTDAIYY